MKRRITDYLPTQTIGKIVQGKVPPDVFQAAKQIMKKGNLGWNEVLTACLLAFVQEHAKK